MNVLPRSNDVHPSRYIPPTIKQEKEEREFSLSKKELLPFSHPLFDLRGRMQCDSEAAASQSESARLPECFNLFEVDPPQILAELIAEVRPPEREVHDRLQEPELIARVVAHAVDPAAKDRP